MRARNTSVGLLLVLLSSQGPLPAWASESSSCVELLVQDGADPGTPSGRPKNRGPFSVRGVVDLEVEVTIPAGLRGEHLLELQFRTPNGHLYQKRLLPFTTKKGSGLSHRALPGRNVTAEVAVAQNRGGSRFLSLRFPVGGTTLARNRLFGEWSIEARLDTSTGPACALGTFTLGE